MTKIDLLRYLQGYVIPDECEMIVAYLNKLSRGRNIAFSTAINVSEDNTHIKNTDSSVYHVVCVKGYGYTYLRNDDAGSLKCALICTNNVEERHVFFAKTPEEFCNVMINRIILR